MNGSLPSKITSEAFGLRRHNIANAASAAAKYIAWRIARPSIVCSRSAMLKLHVVNP